jgi:hypothetical protein
MKRIGERCGKESNMFNPVNHQTFNKKKKKKKKKERKEAGKMV